MQKNRFINNIKQTVTKRAFIVSMAIVVATSILFSLALVFANNIEMPTRIYNANDLDKIRENLSGYYLVMTDIYMTEYKDSEGELKEWTPIGTKEEPFKGKIDFNYKNINDLIFSKDYLVEQGNNLNSDEILVGFLGYSTGVLIHANFYRPVFPKFFELTETNKTVVFGVACALNEGYVTSCTCIVIGNGGSLNAKNLVFGTLVGKNKKQLLNNRCSNTISISCYGSCVVGGVVGISYKNSIISYAVRRGYSTITTFSDDRIIAGGIVGVSYGAKMSNVFHGPSNLNQRETFAIACDLTTHPLCYLGGIAGLIDGDDKTSFENSYSCNKLSIPISSSQSSIGGLIGVNFSQKCSFISCLGDSLFSVGDSSDSFYGVISGSCHGTIFSSNCYFINNNTIKPYFDKSYADETTISYSLLNTLNWPTSTKAGYWSYNDFIFCLNIL